MQQLHFLVVSTWDYWWACNRLPFGRLSNLRKYAGSWDLRDLALSFMFVQLVVMTLWFVGAGEWLQMDTWERLQIWAALVQVELGRSAISMADWLQDQKAGEAMRSCIFNETQCTGALGYAWSTFTHGVALAGAMFLRVGGRYFLVLQGVLVAVGALRAVYEYVRVSLSTTVVKAHKVIVGELRAGYVAMGDGVKPDRIYREVAIPGMFSVYFPADDVSSLLGGAAGGSGHEALIPSSAILSAGVGAKGTFCFQNVSGVLAHGVRTAGSTVVFNGHFWRDLMRTVDFETLEYRTDNRCVKASALAPPSQWPVLSWSPEVDLVCVRPPLSFFAALGLSTTSLSNRKGPAVEVSVTAFSPVGPMRSRGVALRPTGMEINGTHLASTQPGWSGSALIDSSGKVFGVHCGYMEKDGKTVNRYVPHSLLRFFWAEAGVESSSDSSSDEERWRQRTAKEMRAEREDQMRERRAQQQVDRQIQEAQDRLVSIRRANGTHVHIFKNGNNAFDWADDDESDVLDGAYRELRGLRDAWEAGVAGSEGMSLVEWIGKAGDSAWIETPAGQGFLKPEAKTSEVRVAKMPEIFNITRTINDSTTLGKLILSRDDAYEQLYATQRYIWYRRAAHAPLEGALRQMRVEDAMYGVWAAKVIADREWTFKWRGKDNEYFHAPPEHVRELVARVVLGITGKTYEQCLECFPLGWRHAPTPAWAQTGPSASPAGGATPFSGASAPNPISKLEEEARSLRASLEAERQLRSALERRLECLEKALSPQLAGPSLESSMDSGAPANQKPSLDQSGSSSATSQSVPASSGQAVDRKPHPARKRSKQNASSALPSPPPSVSSSTEKTTSSERQQTSSQDSAGSPPA